MIHIAVDGSSQTINAASQVTIKPLATPIGPQEFLVGTGVVKVADLSAASGAEAEVFIENKAAFAIFFCLGTPGTPGLTTANGMDIPSTGFVTLDMIGGLCVWAVSGTVQTAGSGTRVTGGY